MNNFRYIVFRTALALIILLIFLSIYGAFLGAEQAKNFFNSLPLSIFWLVLTIILILGFVAFRRLARIPGLLLMHLGCILVLVGSMWASQAGHKLQKKLFGIDKIPAGSMTIFEEQKQNLVTSENTEQTRLGEAPSRSQTKQLPFYIELKDFRIEYYKPQYLYVQTTTGQSWKIPVEIGTEFPLGDDFGTITILRAFENFKITIDEDKQPVIDSLQPGYNPALQVQIKFPDGTIKNKYVFERFPGHIHPDDRFIFTYRRIVRDYISDVKVVQNGDVLAEKSIEVNHPLHFGGYHFYQHSYDEQAGEYSVLMVCSDSGLNLVYAGYLMLCAGVFWHLWLRHLLDKVKLFIFPRHAERSEASGFGTKKPSHREPDSSLHFVTLRMTNR